MRCGGAMTTTLEAAAELALNLGLTYLLHSTVILGILLVIAGQLREPSGRLVVLRAALLAPFMTTLLMVPRSPGSAPPVSVSSTVEEAAVGERHQNAVPSPDASATVARPLSAEPQPAVRGRMPPLAITLRIPPAVRAGTVVAWVVVALLLLARIGVRHVTLMRRLEGRRVITAGPARRRLDDLIRSHAIGPVLLTENTVLEVPVAIGRREISLPTGYQMHLTDPELQAVLAHELAHLLRGDGPWRLLADVLTAIAWCQPLARLAVRRMADAGEEAADDWAMLGTRNATALTRSIVFYAGRPSRIAGTLAPHPGRPGHLTVRVGRLLMPRETESRWGRHSRIGVAVAVISGMLIAEPRVAVSAVSSAPPRSAADEEEPPLLAAPAVRVIAPESVGRTVVMPDTGERPPSVDRLATAAGASLPQAPQDRWRQVVDIGLTEPDDGIVRLLPFLDDPHSRVRESAVWALAEYDRAALEAAGAVAHIVRLTADEIPSVRRQAAAAIGIHEFAAGLEALGLLLRDPNVAVRGTAVWALAEFRRPELMRPVLELVDDPDAVVRLHVAKALRRAPDREWADPLRRLADDLNADVRRYAVFALNSVLGRA